MGCWVVWSPTLRPDRRLRGACLPCLRCAELTASICSWRAGSGHTSGSRAAGLDQPVCEHADVHGHRLGMTSCRSFHEHRLQWRPCTRPCVGVPAARVCPAPGSSMRTQRCLPRSQPQPQGQEVGGGSVPSGPERTCVIPSGSELNGLTMHFI